MVFWRVRAGAELTPRAFHVGALYGYMTSVASNYAECIWDDFRESIELVAFSA